MQKFILSRHQYHVTIFELILLCLHDMSLKKDGTFVLVFKLFFSFSQAGHRLSPDAACLLDGTAPNPPEPRKDSELSITRV